jgi:2-polyprenyl-3-methyl-5-hydroxy-6-metoxy-1,4-benzoquinol methylase
MVGMSTEVENYGWTADEPYSWRYISPVVLDLVESLGLSKVLDLGSGNGKLCGALGRKCSLVVGVEYDKEGVKIASQAYPGIAFYNMGVQDSPQPLLEKYPGGFDAVISTEVIEHLYLPRLLPKFASALLRPGGYLILSTPYHGYLKNLALALLNKWDHHHMALFDGCHIKFWSRKTLTALLKEQNLEVLKFRGVGRLPWLWKSMVIVARLRSA